jgi:hypothetical protein
MSQQDHIANLNSTSPLTFPDALSAEDLARDLDLFTNTQFFDFDFGDTTPQFTSSLDPAHPRPSEHGGDSVSSFTFLSGTTVPTSGDTTGANVQEQSTGWSL